jgi:hypothetical protein
VKAILGRLKRLEQVQAVALPPPVKLQIGYLKRLPAEYTGERYVVTVSGDAAWERRMESRAIRGRMGDTREFRQPIEKLTAILTLNAPGARAFAMPGAGSHVAEQVH